MARILSRALIRNSQTVIRDAPSPASLFFPAAAAAAGSRRRPVGFRCRSDKPAAAGQLVELDLSESSTDSAGGSGFRRLEEAINSIIIRRSAPDWLPFIPGSSYWIPPLVGSRDRDGAISIVRLSGAPTPPAMSFEESLSLRTPRGYPSLSFFTEGQLPRPKMVLEEATEQSDDEE